MNNLYSVFKYLNIIDNRTNYLNLLPSEILDILGKYLKCSDLGSLSNTSKANSKRYSNQLKILKKKYFILTNFPRVIIDVFGGLIPL